MARKLPVLKTCCFCIPLRVGALIIGYCSVVFNLGILGATTYFTFRLIKNFQIQTPLARIWIVYVTRIITEMVYLILSITLIVGVHKKEPEYLRRYFIFGLAGLIMNIVVISVGILFYRGWHTDLLIAFSLLSVHFYYLIVIRSTYRAMEEELKPRLQRKEYVLKQVAKERRRDVAPPAAAFHLVSESSGGSPLPSPVHSPLH